MIGTFWNLCRACPSMPVDKLHSEYRSTYRWHEYTGTGPDVVRRPPVPNHTGNNAHMEKLQLTRSTEEENAIEGSKIEPAMSQRKKYPELAYRAHEFYGPDGYGTHTDALDNSVQVDRARSEERSAFGGGRPSRRSKSEGPPGANGVTGSPQRRPLQPSQPTRCDSDPRPDDLVVIMDAVAPSGRAAAGGGGLFSKAISKFSTEYRLQFAWPPSKRNKEKGAGHDAAPPRKSLSMGAIKPTTNGVGPAGVHRKRTDLETTKEDNNHELEPLVMETEVTEKEATMTDEKQIQNKKEIKTDQKKHFRPVSQLDYMHSPKKEISERHVAIDASVPAESWYKEVLELRKKAGEYKSRGWGTELSMDQVTDISNKQIELWEQVSRRSSLSALSLASTSHRSITKEEKDKENNKKTSPTKAAFIKTSRAPGFTKPVLDNKVTDNARFRKETIRHHLERTTGIDCSEEGALLPSPTLEKLVPVTPRREEHYSPKRCSPQKGSPQKSSPKKGSPQKGSPQKSKSSPRSGRSHSVGPGVIQSENLSPKRTPRPGSTVTATTASVAAKQKKSPTMSVSAERRPRPTSLSTTVPSRSKSSSVPPKPSSSSICRTADQQQSRPKPSTKHNASASSKSAQAATNAAKPNEDKTPKLEIEDDASIERDVASVTSSAGSALTPREQIVKSPPEPTRVKSPEQILMRSPDPVNWTVPLDTGKTFTVTQNVREGGDSVGTPTPRPQSEVKARSPREQPPPAPQSAPPPPVTILPDAPELHNGNVPSGNVSDNRAVVPVAAEEALVSPSTGRSLASEVLEKARTRFDKFWGKDSKDEDV